MRRAISIILTAALIITVLILPSISVGADLSGDFEYEVNSDDSLTITKYNGGSGEAVIPTQIDGHTVSAIGDKAFYDKAFMTAVDIPDTVKSIGEYAFCNCCQLTSMKLPDSVKDIGDNAFDRCKLLRDIVLPEFLERIGKEAFIDCIGITDVTVINSDILFEENAFGYYHGKNNKCTPVENFVIIGHEASTAQRYAEENGFVFSALKDHSILLGDVDYDCAVTIMDASFIQRGIVQLPMGVKLDEMTADVDGDGSVESADAVFIRRCAEDIQTPYKIGEPINAYVTTKNDPEYVSQMLSVAQSYFDHKSEEIKPGVRTMKYGSALTALDAFTKPKRRIRQIDCSTFVGLVLRGIEYKDTSYADGIYRSPYSYKANPEYSWAIDPYEYTNFENTFDSVKKPVRRAASLGRWLVDQKRIIPMDEKLVNLEEGDIVFWSNMTKDGSPLRPTRYMHISHVAICNSKKPVDLYNSSRTYIKGDLCENNGALYECTEDISSPEEWTDIHWTLKYKRWDKDRYPYCHTVMEVSGNKAVDVVGASSIVEKAWESPNYVTASSVNTISLICRPKLGRD